MGFGAGTMFPCLHQIAAAWYPKNERDRLISFVGSGSDLGVICSMIFVPYLIQLIGWKKIFFLCGLIGILWCIFFEIYGADSPESSKRITCMEKKYILSQQQRTILDTHHQMDKKKKIYIWKILFTRRETWAIYIANFCYDYGWYVFHGWIPQYLMEVVHIDFGRTTGRTTGNNNSLQAAIPYVFGYVGVLFWGRISNFLLVSSCNKYTRVKQVRQLMNGVSFFGFGLFLYLLRFVSTTWMALFFLSLTLFFGRAASVGFWVNMIDICPNPQHAGLLMSVSNTIGNLPGIIANVVTGHILEQTGEWNVVFLIASLILFTGGLFFHFNTSDQPIFQEKEIEHIRKDTKQRLPNHGGSSGSFEDTDLEEEEEEEKKYNDQQSLLHNTSINKY
jgi:ACS family sodium-dependent inorganic phosphate cotransporter